MIDLDAIRARHGMLANQPEWYLLPAERDRRALLAYVDALLAAAGKVTCERCHGSSIALDTETNMGGPCPDCSDLRALLERE